MKDCRNYIEINVKMLHLDLKMFKNELCKDRIERCDLMAFCLFPFVGSCRTRVVKIVLPFMESLLWVRHLIWIKVSVWP